MVIERRIAFVQLLVALAATACQDAVPVERVAAPAATSSRHSMQASTDPRRSPHFYDAMLASVAARVAGFGGVYRQGSTLVILADDSLKLPAIREALGREFQIDVPLSKTRFQRSLFGYDDLNRWRDSLNAHLGIRSLVFTDIQESRNRIAVGVANHDDQPLVRRIAETLGIPAAAVHVERAEFPRLTSGVQDSVNPLMGGLGIVVDSWWGSKPCTLGWSVRLYADSTNDYLITNSHCTGTMGAVDGAVLRGSNGPLTSMAWGPVAL